MIFQDPYGSLNPRQTIGSHHRAPRSHIQGIKPPEGGVKTVQDLMARVGLNPEHYNRFPHEFSGGQRQRIGIARAIALRPKLIVCDEPVSALDVSIQAQVVNLLEDVQDEQDLSYVFIAHDLSVVRHISDRVAVMYLGKIMEIADRDELYGAPLHPYTHALMSAVPLPDPSSRNRANRITAARRPAAPDQPPVGLRVPHPLLEGPGAVRAGGAAAGRAGPAALGWPATSPSRSACPSSPARRARATPGSRLARPPRPRPTVWSATCPSVHGAAQRRCGERPHRTRAGAGGRMHRRLLLVHAHPDDETSTTAPRWPATPPRGIARHAGHLHPR